MMEAAEQSEHKPDIHFHDPNLYLTGITYLDPADPIDSLIIAYQEDLADDTIPSAAQQRILVGGVKTGDLSSAQELIKTHQGLISTVAYPFKPSLISHEDLVQEGAHALVRAAKTYDQAGSADFSDYAAAAIHEALSAVLPILSGNSFIELPQRPMEGIYQFMGSVQPADTDRKLEKMREQAEAREVKEFSAEEMTAMELLHLKEKEASSIMGVKQMRMRSLAASVKEKLGAQTKEEAALIALYRGLVEYDVSDMPGREAFTIDERQVAMLLWLPNKIIGEKLKFPKYKVDKLRASLGAKTNDRTRAEITLMAHINDFAPTEEEMNPPAPTLLELLTTEEKEILPRVFYMRDKDLAEESDIDFSTGEITRMVKAVMRKADLPANNRAMLFLKLYEEGMEFDVVPPEQPLSTALYAEQLEVARHVQWSYRKINEDLDLGRTVVEVGDIVHKIKRKTGARTRQEIALQVAIYDDGSEALERNVETNEWRLAELLGLKALEGCDIEDLLSVTTDWERKVVTVYYLAEKALTWEEASEELGVTVASANSTGVRAARRMLKHLESF